MLVTIALQLISVLGFGLITLLVSGQVSATSFVLGGLAAVIPNGLFALRLAAQRGRPADTYPAAFMFGELLKIALTLGLLVWAVHWQEDVRWVASILGLIVALKVPLFAPLWVKDAPRDWPEYEGD